jgi:hypothetical protein
LYFLYYRSGAVAILGGRPCRLDAFGSWPGQQCKGRESEWRSRRAHTLHRLLAIRPCSVGLRRPRSCCAWGPYACRRQQAVVLGDDIHACSRAVTQLSTSPQQTSLIWLPHTPSPPLSRLLLGRCSTCSRREPNHPFSKRQRGLVKLSPTLHGPVREAGLIV